MLMLRKIVDTTWNAALAHQINANNTSQFGTLYLADFQNVDGQALDPTSFGEYDSNNVWQPKEYSGTYGTNGFHLDFSNNSSATALGEDSSGNGNDWTATNLTSSIDILPAVKFDGNGDYLSLASSTDFAYGTGDFTWEAWVYVDSFSSNRYLLDHGSNGGTIGNGGSSQTTFLYYNSTTGSYKFFVHNRIWNIININLVSSCCSKREWNNIFVYEWGAIDICYRFA